MVQKFHRKVIAGIASLSILVTAFGAGSASAQGRHNTQQQRNNGTGQAVAAVVGLAVIGALIAKSNKDKRKSHAKAVAPKVHAAPKVHHQPQAIHGKSSHRHANRRALPAQCLHSFRTKRGTARLFTNRCMHQTFRGTARLPRQCHRQIWTRHGQRSGWSAGCLRNNGYDVAHY